MNMRKITSLTAALAFILMVLTSIILYIVPQGRVAYWADWHLWGLDKTQWGNIHINMGLLFLLSLILHIYYNWKPIVSYLKNRAKRITIFTKDFNVALVITLAVVLGTQFQVPPFSSFIGLNESIKDAGTAKYGEPPYGHAELSSLKAFAKKMGFDQEASLESLRQAGIQFESAAQSMKAVAKANNIPPEKVYQAMIPKQAETAAQANTLPANPKAGLGKRLLADICDEYGLDKQTIVEGLSAKGIQAKGDMKMKAIAEKNSASPMDIYEAIKAVAGM
jgi:hypothetical protein